MMEIRVLGCHGSLLPGFRTTGFLLNRAILIDAGTVTSGLTLEEQLNLEVALISHAHPDHVKDLLFLADSIFLRKDKPLKIMAPQGILDLLHANLFNNVIWPDFSMIPTVEKPAARFQVLDPGQRCSLEKSLPWPQKERSTFSGTEMSFIFGDFAKSPIGGVALHPLSFWRTVKYASFLGIRAPCLWNFLQNGLKKTIVHTFTMFFMSLHDRWFCIS